jgi:hypothetical protein
VRQSFGAILTQGLQEPVTHRSRPFFRDHQRAVDQTREQMDDLVALDRLTGADDLSGFQRPAAHEYRQSIEQGSLGL